MMISRQWRGLARVERARDYERHLREETFPALEGLAGFVDGAIMKRAVDRGVEFLIVTRWQSLDAIRQFAGDDLEAAVVPPEVVAMMIEYDRRATHYDVVR